MAESLAEQLWFLPGMLFLANGWFAVWWFSPRQCYLRQLRREIIADAEATIRAARPES